MTTICRYGHELPERYVAPRPSIQISYKPKPETLSEQFVHLMSGRPRDQVIVYKVKPSKHHYDDYDDSSHPMYLNHVPGKRGQSRDRIARLERRYYSPEPAMTANNSVRSRYSYEHERRLPPIIHADPETYATVSVSPELGYPSRLPKSQYNKYYRPRVHWADDEGYGPHVTEIRQRR